MTEEPKILIYVPTETEKIKAKELGNKIATLLNENNNSLELQMGVLVNMCVAYEILTGADLGATITYHRKIMTGGNFEPPI